MEITVTNLLYNEAVLVTVYLLYITFPKSLDKNHKLCYNGSISLNEARSVVCAAAGLS